MAAPQNSRGPVSLAVLDAPMLPVSAGAAARTRGASALGAWMVTADFESFGQRSGLINLTEFAQCALPVNWKGFVFPFRRFG